jgi:hypothetical protein
MKGFATGKTLYKFIDAVLCALNSKLLIGGIFYDLNCANHYILLSKLEVCVT